MRRLLVFFSIAVGLLFIAVPATLALTLYADYSCDGRVDLDDYTVRVNGGSVDYGLLMREWGRTGSSGDGGCVTPTPIASTNPTPTPAATSPSPSPSSSPSAGGIDLSDPNLVAYFPMEETSGPIISQISSADSEHLIPEPDGFVIYDLPGKVGRGLVVNGVGNGLCSTDDDLECSRGEAFDFDGDFSLGMWVNMHDTTGFLFRKWESGRGLYSFFMAGQTRLISAFSRQHPYYLFGELQQAQAGEFAAMPIGGGFFLSSVDVERNEWHHLVVVRDSASQTVRVYQDGERVATRNGLVTTNDTQQTDTIFPIDLPDSQDPFKVGEFEGVIDEVFAYDRALTDQEVSAIYEASR